MEDDAAANDSSKFKLLRLVTSDKLWILERKHNIVE